MRRLRTLALFAAVLALVLFGFAASSSHPALAVGSQIRTFVASTGSDANPCSRVAPCRTFGAALTQTAAAGEIVALDSGGYGAVTITQAVTIVAAPGIQASISPTSGAAITVNAGPSDVVVLRNLYLNAQGGSLGISYTSGAALYVEGLTINGFVGNVFLGVGIFATASGSLYVRDTVIRNGGGAGLAISASTSGVMSISIENSRFENNLNGLDIGSNITAVVRDTVSINNAGFGFVAQPGSGAARLDLEGCLASGNGNAGIASAPYASGSSTVRVSNCVVTDNVTGVSFTVTGNLLTRVNNTVEGNTTNGSFSGSYAAK